MVRYQQTMKMMLSSPDAKHTFQSMPYPAPDISRMTVGERLALIEQVWESLRHDGLLPPLSDAERAVFERRRAEHRADPATAVTWETVREGLVSDQEADEEKTRASKHS